MFSVIVTFLTTFALLCHSFVGCNWHHEHRVDGEPLHEVVTSEQDASTCCQHGHSGHNETSHDKSHELTSNSPEENDPCGESGICNEGICQYVKSSSPDISQLIALPLPGTSSAPIDRCPAGAALFPQTCGDIPKYGTLSSLHRCALTQTWQI